MHESKLSHAIGCFVNNDAEAETVSPTADSRCTRKRHLPHHWNTILPSLLSSVKEALARNAILRQLRATEEKHGENHPTLIPILKSLADVAMQVDDLNGYSVEYTKRSQNISRDIWQNNPGDRDALREHVNNLRAINTNYENCFLSHESAAVAQELFGLIVVSRDHSIININKDILSQLWARAESASRRNQAFQ